MKLLDQHLQRQLRGLYQIERKIGQGGMGEVWAARDLALAVPVAIKVLDEMLRDDAAFERRFVEEMRMLARLRHTRIVQVMTAGKLPEDGRLFMVMELLRGKTMRQIDNEARDAGEVCGHNVAAYRAYQILDALTAAHDAGIVHRDVKPDNVMVAADGELKLLDFGVAKAVERTGQLPVGARRERISTNSSTVLGTAAYVAPELIAGLSGDARGDLYAVGLMLLQELTGEYPYPVALSDQAAVLRAHLEMEPVVRRENNPECPPELWALALKLVEKDPAARWQSATRVRDVLSSLIRGSKLPEELTDPVVRKVVAEHKAGKLRAKVQEDVAREARVRAGSRAEVESVRSGVSSVSAEELPRDTVPMGTLRLATRPRANADAVGPHGTERLDVGFVAKSAAANVTVPEANVTVPMRVVDVRAMIAKRAQAAPVRATVQSPPMSVQSVPVRPRLRRTERLVTIFAVFGVASVAGAVIWRTAGAGATPAVTTPSATATATPSATPAATATASATIVAMATPSATAATTATPRVTATATVTVSAKAPSAPPTAHAPAAPKHPPLGSTPEPKNKLPPLPFPPQ